MGYHLPSLFLQVHCRFGSIIFGHAGVASKRPNQAEKQEKYAENQQESDTVSINYGDTRRFAKVDTIFGFLR
jgi:hypothetical protein